MKKLLSLILVVLFAALAFTGCAEKELADTKETTAPTQAESTQAATEAPTKATEAPTQKPTPAPTEKPTKAAQKEKSDSSGEMYISDEAYYTIEYANFVQLNDDNTAVMQINLYEGMLKVTGSYYIADNGILTFGEMVDPHGNVAILEGAEFHEYVEGLMMIYGVEDRFVLQGWNTPPAFLDGGAFRSPDRPDFDTVHG